MGMPGRTDDHQWSQRHLSHYVEGELRPRARRRLDRHARGCADCGRGIRAMRAPTGATRVELPMFRDAAGQSRAAIVLPEEVHGPIGDAVIEALIEQGLAKRRFSVPIPD